MHRKNGFMEKAMLCDMEYTLLRACSLNDKIQGSISLASQTLSVDPGRRESGLIPIHCWCNLLIKAGSP